jgi:hypothetical protein
LSCGTITQVKHIGGDNYEVIGKAYLPWKNEPAHAVFLSFKNSSGKPILFSYVVDPFMPDSTAGKIKRYDMNSYKIWRVMISRKMFPLESTEISAWAFDALLGKAYLLGNSTYIRF